MKLNFSQKIETYFKTIEDLDILPNVINGEIINDDLEFKEDLQKLILDEGIEFVIGAITKNIVIENINSTQQLIEKNSDSISQSIDLILDSLEPIFSNIKFDSLDVCKTYYGMSEGQSEIFIDSIINKHRNKEEFLDKFFDNLKKYGVFQELKDDVTQSTLDEFMFSKNGKENSKAYNLAFKFKKYKQELNQFDLFFEYLQETYQPNEIYELMSKFTIYVKTKNFHYDLLTDNIFNDEKSIESLIELRKKFTDFKNNENKNEFFQSLISRIKKVQVPAKITTKNAIDIYSAKITFNNSLPHKYLNGRGMKTPGPFIDYAVKNRCFVENNETKNDYAFGRIMSMEPMNDIFNHQYAYRKENIAYNKLNKDGFNVQVFECQKPSLASKFTKKIIKIDDAEEIDEIISIFDNLINLARNHVEKPEFNTSVVQIGKNFYNIDTLENVYEMTAKLIQHINTGNISIEEQATINLIDKSFKWINTCIDLETNEKNLDLIYSKQFRDDIFTLSQKLNAPLQNSVYDIYGKLNPEQKFNNKIKATILIETEQVKKIEAFWKDVEYFDKIVVQDKIKDKLDDLKTSLEKVSKLGAKYFEGFEKLLRANGRKVYNIKQKYDDILVGKNRSRTIANSFDYHSATSFKAIRDYEIMMENVLIARNRLLNNTNDFLGIKEPLLALKSIFNDPLENLTKHTKNWNAQYKSVLYLKKEATINQKKEICTLINSSIKIISHIDSHLGKTKQIEKFADEKNNTLIECEKNKKELSEVLKVVLDGKAKEYEKLDEKIKFKVSKPT